MITTPHRSLLFIWLLGFLCLFLGFLRISLFTSVWLLEELCSSQNVIIIITLKNCGNCELRHCSAHTLIFGSSLTWSLSFSSGFSSLFIFSASLRFLLSSSLHLRRSSSRRRLRSSSLRLLSSFFSSLIL